MAHLTLMMLFLFSQAFSASSSSAAAAVKYSVGSVLSRRSSSSLAAATAGPSKNHLLSKTSATSLQGYGYGANGNVNDGEGEYDYSDGPLGPANWGNLHEDWSLCKDGTMQSPIAVESGEAFQNASLELATSYDLALVDLTYSAHGPKLTWRGNSSLLYWNSYGPYRVVNMHWHTYSEHTIDDQRYPLEVHIVHAGPDNETLVIGIPYILGDEDPFITFVMQWEINPQAVILENIKSNYFHYMGSLTTPPCSEGVTWILRDATLQLSAEQLGFFVETIGGQNARPLQPLNDRIVYKHQESIIEMLKR